MVFLVSFQHNQSQSTTTYLNCFTDFVQVIADWDNNSSESFQVAIFHYFESFDMKTSLLEYILVKQLRLLY